MRVAREFNAAIAERYGVEKLDSGCAISTPPGGRVPRRLLAAEIRLRDKKGRWISKPFHSAKTRDIRDAIALQQDGRESRRRVSVELGKRARRLADALPPPAGGRQVRVRRAEHATGALR
jgi:hypothetical protein